MLQPSTSTSTSIFEGFQRNQKEMLLDAEKRAEKRAEKDEELAEAADRALENGTIPSDYPGQAGGLGEPRSSIRPAIGPQGGTSEADEGGAGVCLRQAWWCSVPVGED